MNRIMNLFLVTFVIMFSVTVYQTFKAMATLRTSSYQILMK